MSKIPMMMSFKCSNHCKIVFHHLRLSFNLVNTVLMFNIGIKYQYVSRSLWANAHDFRKWQGCALIRVCMLIRTNMVHHNLLRFNTVLLHMT